MLIFPRINRASPGESSKDQEIECKKHRFPGKTAVKILQQYVDLYNRFTEAINPL
jgi:hypothetical protein